MIIEDIAKELKNDEEFSLYNFNEDVHTIEFQLFKYYDDNVYSIGRELAMEYFYNNELGDKVVLTHVKKLLKELRRQVVKDKQNNDNT